MAENVDTKKLTDEYIKGATPDELALKYDLDAQKVVDIVTKPVAETPTVTQAELDAQPEVRKGK